MAELRTERYRRKKVSQLTPRGNREVCARCGFDGEHNHHIIPQRLGGGDEPENIERLCDPCHKEWHWYWEPPPYESQEAEIEAIKKMYEVWLNSPSSRDLMAFYKTWLKICEDYDPVFEEDLKDLNPLDADVYRCMNLMNKIRLQMRRPVPRPWEP